ncbi:MAG: RNA polymerase sigma factor [Lachnospiraceae bacterium]|nr:RNA polymerase sigma factor [Lachnospiraceae bacterium]MBD5481247.1 RNA polymerase sigma factor [Lachnospiraceae bacterium]
MNREQLEQCINEYGKDIYAFCSQMTRSIQETEDLYQDTFLKAVEISDKIDFENNPKSYLVSIALRLWKNRKRKYAWRARIAGTKQLVEEGTSEETENGRSGQENPVEEGYLNKERKKQVRDAVERLDEKYRIPVYLYYTLQLPIAEIADIMKLSNGAVKSRLHKARNILKQELEVVLDEM